MKRVPRLRTGLSDMELRNFLLDEERIGTKCQKHHATHFNGWRFPPLTECREAWDRLYGAAPWDTDLEEWQKPETL